ncbi:hypothetical protein DPMN_113334 [Dreissena polymorpha]|uniref:Uncharacterized protein n=1 Tax=Dreissena polymorpha TaxID=45954 RepID=A0A9D4QQR2_DREPO|nr:hypothetical protein DPMN_113334 [Dreissena polymorpha]
MFIILLTEIVFSPICVYTGFGPFPENKAFDCSQEATFRSDASPPTSPLPSQSLYGVPFGSKVNKTY